MYAVRRKEESGKHNLEGGKRDVCGEKKRRSWAWGEDRRDEIGEESCHDGPGGGGGRGSGSQSLTQNSFAPQLLLFPKVINNSWRL